MSLVKISGIDEAITGVAKVVTVDPEKGWSNFLVMVNLNLFSLKKLLLSNPGITYGALKDWCDANGFDFNQLNLILTAK